MKLLKGLILSLVFVTSGLSQVDTDMVNQNDENLKFFSVQGFTIESLVHFKDSWQDATGFYATYGSISTSNHWSLIFQTGYFSFNANPDAGFTADEKFNIITETYRLLADPEKRAAYDAKYEEEKIRQNKVSTLIVLSVDASGSMAAQERMTATKGAILSLLLDAYQRRDRVGMVVFRKNMADKLYPNLSSPWLNGFPDTML